MGIKRKKTERSGAAVRIIVFAPMYTMHDHTHHDPRIPRRPRVQIHPPSLQPLRRTLSFLCFSASSLRRGHELINAVCLPVIAKTISHDRRNPSRCLYFFWRYALETDSNSSAAATKVAKGGRSVWVSVRSENTHEVLMLLTVVTIVQGFE